MFYQVTIREKGHSTAMETSNCTNDEIDYWCAKGRKMANRDGKEILVEFKPREQVFEFYPEKQDDSLELRNGKLFPSGIDVRDNNEITDDAPYPKQGTSPSVCEILGRGD